MKTWMCLFTALALMTVTKSVPAANVNENFNDNNKSPMRWAPDVVVGNGVLTETNQHLEYTCSNGTTNDAVSWPLIASRGPYSGDWEARIDLFNSTGPTQDVQNCGFGISIMNCADNTDEVFAELYASQPTGLPERKGFRAGLITDNGVPATVDTGDFSGSAPLTGSIRIVFDNTTKVLTTYFATNGNNWVQFGSFGISGAGGADGNGNWSMTGSNEFCLSVYGSSTFMTVTSGQMFGDGFQASGLSGPPAIYDLALVKLKAPKTISLSSTTTSLTKFVKVTFQNRSIHSETINSFTNLVSLVVETLGTNCSNPVVVLHNGSPNKLLPLVLASKKKLTVVFDVTYDCANDVLKGAGHEDFRYLATVDHAALDGNADIHTADDNCPRAPLAGGIDPYPDNSIKDKGCGSKDPVTKQLGADILTDVVEKP